MSPSRAVTIATESGTGESSAASGATRFVPAMPSVRSEDLFGKDREIIIEHCGMQYHLRLTKANKLILTK
jgi:hemin uptake protein HemP